MAERLEGIDISAWQKGINFDEIEKAGVKFVFIRAGVGGNKDSQVDLFVAECEKRGIKYGFYWYSYALTVDRAKEEAKRCIEVIKKYKPDYPVCYDQEDESQIDGLTRRIRTDMAITFCETIRDAGFTPGVYANPSWFETYYKKNEIVGVYDIWLACWTYNPDIPPRWRYGEKIWQYGLRKIGKYNVDGDISYVDYDLFDDEPEVVFAENDIVQFKGGYQYVTPDATVPTGEKCTAGLARVYAVAADTTKHRYYVHGIEGEGGANTLGWVDADCLEPVKDVLSIGDRVRVNRGAKTYKGGSWASFVFDMTYTVMQIGAGVASDYIVIGINGAVTGAIHAADLTKV